MFQNNQLESAWLILTNRCNLACKYCWVPEHSAESSKAQMTLETARESIRFLEKYGRENINITLFGGEPLLEPELVKQILDEFAYIDFTIYTNTLLLDKDLVDFFYARRDGLSLKLSIDGLPETQIKNRGKMYDVELMKDIFAKFPTAEARITVHNPESVYNDVKFIQGLGAKHISVKVTNFVKLDNDFFHTAKIVLGQVKSDLSLEGMLTISDGTVKQVCNIGKNYVAIAPNGDIYPCDVFYWLGRNRLGNIRTGWDLKSVDEFCAQLDQAKLETCTSCLVEHMYFKDVAEHNDKLLQEVLK